MRTYEDSSTWNELKDLDEAAVGCFPVSSPQTARFIYVLIQKVKELEERLDDHNL